MIDPVLEALAEYERTVAPAYELIRRARARAAERIAAAASDPLPAAAMWARMAQPDEPDHAALLVEGMTSPTAMVGGSAPALLGASGGSGSPTLPIQSTDGDREAPEAEPEAGDSPPVAAPPVTDTPDGNPRPRPERPSGSQPGRVRADRGTRSGGTPAPASPATCDGCGKEFPSAANVGRHRRFCKGRAELAAPEDPDPGAPEEKPEPWVPRPEGVGGTGPVTFGGRERWLCDRCSAPFSSEESRDRHQATHPPIKPVLPVGGTRIRRTPAPGDPHSIPTPAHQNGGLGQ